VKRAITKLERARELVRDVETGVTAPLRKSDLRHAAQKVDALLDGHAPDELVHVPVATLRTYREAVRDELVEELKAQGRLLPDGPLKVAPTRAA
jgi:hypothetical protein